MIFIVCNVSHYILLKFVLYVANNQFTDKLKIAYNENDKFITQNVRFVMIYPNLRC